MQQQLSHQVVGMKIYTVKKKKKNQISEKKNAVIILKFEQCGFTKQNVSKRCSQNGKLCRPDQTAPTLFAQICLSEWSLPIMLYNHSW